jgi:spore maturation protein CgeB
MMDDALPLRHRGRAPRLLLLTSAYFLLGELKAACRRLDVPHLLLDFASRSVDRDLFVRTIRETAASFKPDAIVTVNHLGVDHEGVLYALAGELKLPLVSWFVDNPEFILPLYQRPDPQNTLILTWDADSLEAVRGYGFTNVFWLPLGADPERFRPGRAGRPEWRSRVSFVGNSMVAKTASRLRAAAPGPALQAAFVDLARAFGQSGERSVGAFLAAARPDLESEFGALPLLRRVAFATALVWHSTLEYRLGCVAQTLPFEPLIAGDPGWSQLLAGVSATGGQAGYRLHRELSYYDDLPGFYPASEVNFNCTSLQMKGAVNQRVFDVPAAGAFLLTDHRGQIERLFEPDTEIALFRGVEEIGPLVERFLADAEGRERVARAGRARVLAEHTYEHRLSALMAAIDQSFPGRVR